ncbi:MAG: alpha/beta hydrolase [Burkholderiales bacterium]
MSFVHDFLPFLRSMLTIAACVVLGLPLLLYLAQDSMLFHPPPAPRAASVAAVPGIEAVRVPVADQLTLNGWLARPAGAAAPLPLIIYFGGNAEEVSWMAGMQPRLAGHAILAVNYRGYAGNPGNPGETAFLADALAIYDWAVAQPGIDARRVVAMGRSLGSAVAVHLAAERPIARVVAITPLDSVRSVASSIYPFVPVSLLLKHPFDAGARAARISAPLLAVVAGADRVIPPRHARALFDTWRGPKRWVELPGADHNDVDTATGFWPAIAAFLAEKD